jgi:hypothetical protein
MKKRGLLGNSLMEDGYISRDQLLDVIRVQKEEGGLFGEVLIKLGYIDEKTLSEYLEKQRIE